MKINDKALGAAYEVLDKNVICGEGSSFIMLDSAMNILGL